MTAQWAPDPTGRYAQRYWDGTRWTDLVAGTGGGMPQRDPMTAASGLAPPQHVTLQSAATSNGHAATSTTTATLSRPGTTTTTAAPAASTPAVERRRPVSATAVLGFVLSLAWLAGIGSVLGVIVSRRARRTIAASKGAERGDGLARVGILLGVTGIVGAVFFWSLGGSDVASNDDGFSTAVTTISEPVELSPPAYGVTSVTVHSLASAAPSGFVVPAAGTEFVVADVEVCAGSSASSQSVPTGAFLLRAGKTSIDPSRLDAQLPPLRSVTALDREQCSRGFITYEKPIGVDVRDVRFIEPQRTTMWLTRTGAVSS